jgi:hypothetical protein
MDIVSVLDEALAISNGLFDDVAAEQLPPPAVRQHPTTTN